MKDNAMTRIVKRVNKWILNPDYVKAHSLENKPSHYFRVTVEVVTTFEKDVWATSRDDAREQAHQAWNEGFKGWYTKQVFKKARVSWFPRFWMDSPP